MKFWEEPDRGTFKWEDNEKEIMRQTPHDACDRWWVEAIDWKLGKLPKELEPVTRLSRAATAGECGGEPGMLEDALDDGGCLGHRRMPGKLGTHRSRETVPPGARQQHAASRSKPHELG